MTGPLGEPVAAQFGLSEDGGTALIEMAAASGLMLLPPQRRDPLAAATCGRAAARSRSPAMSTIR